MSVEERLNVLVDSARAQTEMARQAEIARLREAELLRGIKYIRMPLFNQVGANPFNMGGDLGFPGGGRCRPRTRDTCG